MKVERIFLVACREAMISNKTFYLAVYTDKSSGRTRFATCHSDLEESLKDEYPDLITFGRVHGEPEWFEDLDSLSDEMEEFPWIRGTLYHALPGYEEHIGHLVYRTQAGEGDAWYAFKP